MNPSFKPCWVFCHMQANFNSNLQNVYQKLNTTSNTHFNFYLVVIHLCERQRERFPHPQILYPKMTCDSVSEPGWSWGWELDLDLPYGPHGPAVWIISYYLPVDILARSWDQEQRWNLNQGTPTSDPSVLAAWLEAFHGTHPL